MDKLYASILRSFLLLPILSCAILNAQNGGPISQSNKHKKPQFRVCDGTYALCTTAKCVQTATAGVLSCACDVKYAPSNNLSAGGGGQMCRAVPRKQPTPGMVVPSRYYPIKSYVACSNARPWGWCLDMPCIVGTDTSQANCLCTVAKDQGTYLFVTDYYHTDGCDKETISSATVEGSNQLTNFLKSTRLKPFPIKVLEPLKK
jgi:hypothetical protein